MSRVALLLVAIAGAATTAGVQACAVFCADCYCPDLEPLVVTRADDPDLVGAEIRDDGTTLVITYEQRGVNWTVSYAVPLPGGSGSGDLAP